MSLSNFFRFEPPSVRQERLQATTLRLTGEVTRLTELEENLRRFREVEARQNLQFRQPRPTFQPPTPEQTATRRGQVSPDPALRGTDVGDRQQSQLELFQRLIAQGVDPEEAAQRAFSGQATFTRGETVTPAGQLALTRGEDLQPSQLTPPGTVSDVVGQLPAVAGAPARFLDPIAAAALQVAESPAGGGIPGIRGLRELQAEAGPAGRALGGADIPGPLGLPVEAAGAVAEAAGATFPRQRTFGEVFEGGAVNPLAAALGSEEEQRKAQAVLEEAGLARSLAFQLVFDPLNLVPVIGFTKVDDFARLLRTAARATGQSRQAAATALRNSETVQAVLRGAREAPEALEATAAGRGALLQENRTLKTLVQEGRATPAQEARLTEVRQELQVAREAGGGPLRGGQLRNVAPEVESSVTEAMNRLPPDVQDAIRGKVKSVKSTKSEAFGAEGGNFDQSTGRVLIHESELAGDVPLHELLHAYVIDLKDYDLVRAFVRARQPEDVARGFVSKIDDLERSGSAAAGYDFFGNENLTKSLTKYFETGTHPNPKIKAVFDEKFAPPSAPLRGGEDIRIGDQVTFVDRKGVTRAGEVTQVQRENAFITHDQGKAVIPRSRVTRTQAAEGAPPLRGGGRAFPEELTTEHVGEKLAGFEPPRGPPPRGPTVVADAPLEPWQAVVGRIAEKLPEARKTYKLTELSRRAELTKRTGEFFEEFNKLVGEGAPERVALARAKGKFAGELPDIEFAEALAVTQDDIDILMGRAVTYMRDTGKAFEVDNAITAIEAMGRKRVPRPFEIKAIRNIFGDELADTIAAAAKDKTFWDTFMEVWMMPKAIRSAFDISFPARQGIMAAPRHPLMWLDSIKTSVKGWVKPQDVVDDFLRMKSDSSLVGVKVADGTTQDLKLGQIADSIGILAEEVEPFIRSGLAERIYLIGPLIRRSRISFTGAGNKFRFDLLRHTLARWKTVETAITPERLQKLGDFFNALTGRSTIFERLGKKVRFPLVDLLQATWWSPAYRMSGPEAFGIVARNLPGVPGRDAAIGRIAAENLVAFVGTGVGILGLLKASGVADVQVDPRSSDFGKIRLGPTRLNFWGTSQLVARSIAQAITTTRLDPELGPQSVDPGDVFARYFRSGASPEIGFIWDGITGETFLGERLRTSEERGISALDIFRREFDPTVEGGGDRWIPLAWLDIKEGIEEDQTRGGIAGAAGILGLGVASFEPRASQELQNIPEFLIELQDGTRFDQRQLNEIDEFLGRVKDFRAEIRLEFGEEALGRITTTILIDELGRSEGQDQDFADVAKLLRFGSSTRDQLRNPKWVRFIVQNIDEIRADRPDLAQRGFVIDELRELELAVR